MAIDARSVPKLAKKARLRFDRHSGKHMIMYPERGLELNDSAAEIAKRCDGTMSVMEIAKDIVKELRLSDVEEAAITTDVIAFVEDLESKGLLE